MYVYGFRDISTNYCINYLLTPTTLLQFYPTDKGIRDFFIPNDDSGIWFQLDESNKIYCKDTHKYKNCKNLQPVMYINDALLEPYEEESEHYNLLNDLTTIDNEENRSFHKSLFKW